MSAPFFERLSPQDAAFLSAETPSTPLHVASLFVSDAGPVATPAGGVDIERIRRFIGSRLDGVPRYRQRILNTPGTGTPVWVDDEHFNLEFHVRHTSLPRPGSPEQLKRLMGRVAEQRLDRSRPLWELWIVEGVDGGRSFGTLSKVHHCMIDGVAGTELMTLLMSPQPEDSEPVVTPFVARPHPGPATLLSDEAALRLVGPWSVPGRIRELLAEADDPREELGRALRGAADLIAQGLRRASETPLNGRTGPHRRFEYLSMELDEVKAIKDKLGGTINDVVLAVVSGAVRRFMEQRFVDPRSLDFRVSAPVSMRTQSEQGTLGNRVSAWLLSLPLDETDPVRALERIRRETEALKRSRKALGADLLSAATEWTGTTLLSLGTQLQSLSRIHNMIVTNVPGPQLPLYTLGARLREAYPSVPLFPGQGLGIALFSYDGMLFWGLNADADAMPDIARFRDDIERTFAELQAATVTPPV